MTARISALAFGLLRGLAGTLLFAATLVLVGLILGPIRLFFDSWLP